MQTVLYYSRVIGEAAHLAARFLAMLYLHRAACRVRGTGLR